MQKNLLIGLIALGLLGAFILAAWRWQRRLEEGLPPRIVYATQAEASAAAGLSRIDVLGTGSMVPYIPAAPAGADPLRTICAYAVRQEGATYDGIRPGSLCLYSSEFSRYIVMHQAAQLDSFGWVMSGLNNRHSESSWRVTRTNFVGLVRAVHVWSQP